MRGEDGNMSAEKNSKHCEGEKIPLRERICRGLDLPSDLLPGTGLVELRGRGGVTVQGGGKILTYTPDLIRIQMKESCLSIVGKRLVCTSYFLGSVTVDGWISSVSFEEV